MAETATKTKTLVVKPEKPDEEQYKKDLAEAEKQLSVSQEKLNSIKAKLDLAKPQNKDSPTAQKQQELRNELSSIRQKQAGAKNSRSTVQEKLKKLDEQIKSRQNEQKSARSKMGPYKTAEDVDKEISRLQARVDSGTMKLVDEKKTLADITQLHKTKKGLGGLDQSQRAIDDLKSQSSELRKQLDDPEAKALSERYTAVAGELDALRAEQDGAFKNLNALRDERTAAQKDQQEKYQAVRALKDKYFGSRRAYQDYEREAQRARRDRIKAEREAQDAARRKAAAQQRLDEASAPAYGDEINSAEGLIRYFDPSAAPATEKKEPGKYAAEAKRKVDESDMKGLKLAKRDEDEENYMVMGKAGKKGKKGRKGGAGGAAGGEAESSEGGKFNLSIGIIEQLASLNIDPPATQADVPAVVDKLKEKLAHWKEDQDRKTKENIAKAQKEIDRLEAEAKEAAANDGPQGTRDAAKKPAAKNQGVDPVAAATVESAEAQAKQEADAVQDAEEDLAQASIEDSKA